MNLSFLGMFSAILTALDVIVDRHPAHHDADPRQHDRDGRARADATSTACCARSAFCRGTSSLFVLGEALTIGVARRPARAWRSPIRSSTRARPLARREHGRLLPVLPHRADAPRSLALVPGGRLQPGRRRAARVSSRRRLEVTDALAAGRLDDPDQLQRPQPRGPPHDHARHRASASRWWCSCSPRR